jgi:hypothetical protein
VVADSAQIEQLLDLKHKQANLLEEQMTRVLTSAIFRINEETDKQGKTLMWFTTVTIVFVRLPMFSRCSVVLPLCCGHRDD